MLLMALLSITIMPAIAQYGGTGTLTTSSSSGGTGSSVTVSGSGFEPGIEVKVYFASTPVYLGSSNADSTGYFSKTVTIPSDASEGTHTITAVGGERTLTASFTVTSESSGYAYTGAKILFWLLAGIAIMSLGLAVMKSDSIRTRISRSSK